MVSALTLILSFFFSKKSKWATTVLFGIYTLPRCYYSNNGTAENHDFAESTARGLPRCAVLQRPFQCTYARAAASILRIVFVFGGQGAMGSASHTATPPPTRAVLSRRLSTNGSCASALLASLRQCSWRYPLLCPRRRRLPVSVMCCRRQLLLSVEAAMVGGCCCR